MKHRTLYRVLWCLSGILLVVMGVLFLSSPTTTMVTLSDLLAVVMLVDGIIDMATYFTAKDFVYGAGWVLLDGVLTTIAGLFLQFNRTAAVLAVPILFSLWILTTGITHTVRAFGFRRLGSFGWGWLCTLGVLEILAGVLTLFEPITAMVAISVILGVVLLLKGVSTTLNAIFLPRWMD